VARYKLLVDKDEIPRQQYDTAVDEPIPRAGDVDARRAAVAEAEQNIRVAQSAVDQANAAHRAGGCLHRIRADRAAAGGRQPGARQIVRSPGASKTRCVDQARLNLSYCTIVAPVSGIVEKKSVEVGSNVSPGQELMAVVPLDDIWVTADFKEAQLRHMKAGQRVTFSVDAYGREYKGRVTGIGGASGSLLSLLPPENATGNFVKVVQRLPVRIDIDPNQNDDHRLRPGMSVEPKVYVRVARTCSRWSGVVPSRAWRPKFNPWLIGVVVAMAAFMEVLDTSIANVALPYMAGGLGASNDESTWVLTSYLVSNAIVLPISGWLASLFGRKRFFMSAFSYSQ
jgi:membrane fusion protein, multidrug efflux system